MLLLTNGSVRLLFIAQALYWSCSLIGITLTSLIGIDLAPMAELATLPLALLVVGNLVCVHPLSMIMQHYGRRTGLFLGAASGVVGGAVVAGGVYQASAMYYRYAALEAVRDDQKGRAAALVVGGGVLAALIAPEIASYTRNMVAIPFAGSYLALAGLATIAALIMLMLRDGGVPAKTRTGGAVMLELLRRPRLRGAIAISAAGHGIMILVMTATPLAMKFCGFDVDTAANVIRWHIIGMFLPAFAAGPMIDHFGARLMAMVGALALLFSVAFAVSGISFSAFLISSFLLGIGWNLMLLAGTTLLGEGHDASERGHAQSLMELGNSITGTVASLVAGALIAGAGWNIINFGVLPVLLVAIFLMWAGGRKPLTQGA